MLARFFIDRPVLAWVISIVIVLLGTLAALFLPIAQYPEVAPPIIRVTASYPGANARVVADTVAAPIEQQVNGVERMMYMSSQSSNDGSYTLDVTFELGTDINLAQILVQNAVQIAQTTLPDQVRASGVAVKKQSAGILLVVSLYSEDDPTTGRPHLDQLYLSNYATIQVRDALSRLEGVGNVTLLGAQDYSMRVWLDPEKLAARNLTADDVVKVFQEQNVQVAAGRIGQPPVPKGQQFQYPINTLGRLTEPEAFANMIVKTGSDGQVTYLRDVGRIELGARSLDQEARLDGKPSAAAAIFQLLGSNALNVADRVKAKMNELEQRFPKGLRYRIAYDTTPFIRESVRAVIDTLIDAILLVVIVVLLFLQDWKSVLLPVIDVAVSLVGTFAVMKLLGFSFNNLTLFGLVLAIGIVVDDSIVVLENIERWLDKGEPVREATIKAMGEITSPIFAITLVLASVLLPSAFLGGVTGQFFRQFAVTISVAMVISAVNAMTMTPARAAWVFGGRNKDEGSNHGKEVLPWWSLALLGGWLSVLFLTPVCGAALGLAEPATKGGAISSLRTAGAYTLLALPGIALGAMAGWFLMKFINRVLGFCFGLFNRLFDLTTRIYGRTVGWCLRLGLIVFVIYAVLVALTGYLYLKAPSGFIPNQDKGYLAVSIQLPDAASLERTTDVLALVDQIARDTPGVANTISISGSSVILNSNSSNAATLFISLKSFDERRDPSLAAGAITTALTARYRKEIPQARILVFGAPAVDGLGNAGGFKMMIQSTGNADLVAIQKQADAVAAKGGQQPGLVGLFNGFRAQTPAYFIEVDREKIKTLNVSLNDVFETLQVFLGGYYVNDFNQFGRTWQVNLQADGAFRTNVETLKQMKVRTTGGDMVPLGSVLRIQDDSGPVSITRYNLYPAAAVYGASLPFVSTGEAIQAMETVAAAELPRSMSYEWTELSYLQKQEGRSDTIRALLNNATSAFVLGIVLVFFVLAGLYESWSLPLAVILVMPMCILCALIGITVIKSDVNIFVQVGFVVLIGMAAKNAILIVEFARDRELEGVTPFDAAVEAAKARLRPIIMTSFAFILGVVPLVIAQGAGAEMRRSLGTAVFAGMIGVTAFGIFLTPVFYYLLRRLTSSGHPPNTVTEAGAVAPPGKPTT